MTPQLKALQDAYDILSKARSETCMLAAQKPYRALLHAQDHLSKEADQILSETIFADPGDEPEPCVSSPMPRRSYYDHASGIFKLEEPMNYDPITGKTQ